MSQNNVPAQPGRIEVITGPMFSGKSEELIRRLKRAQIAKRRVLCFKPDLDVRYHRTAIASHSSQTLNAHTVANVGELKAALLPSISEVEVIGIDEAQFFDASLVPLALELVHMEQARHSRRARHHLRRRAASRPSPTCSPSPMKSSSSPPSAYSAEPPPSTPSVSAQASRSCSSEPPDYTKPAAEPASALISTSMSPNSWRYRGWEPVVSFSAPSKGGLNGLRVVTEERGC